jgi:predicted DNA-binding protein
MPKTVTLRINDETYRSFSKRARTENRSLANFIETAVKEHIEECDFVDDSEMAEILANERLVERLRKGSKGAARKKGTMIG